jgi:hypothetical protein
MGDNQRAALATLFDVYKQRPDLQSAYPHEELVLSPTDRVGERSLREGMG